MRILSRRPRLAPLTVALAVALVLAGCGGAARESASTAGSSPGEVGPRDVGPRPDLPVAAASADGPLPVVTVRDLTGDRWVQFADFVPADKPLLVWFWAPH